MVSNFGQSDVIMSIVEGRGKAKGEIGLAYIDLHSPIQYVTNSMKIVYESSANTMIIDPLSTKILEILINLSNPASNETLFGVINRTKTRPGYVLLRSSILQPSTDIDLISKRHDMVEAISNSIENFNNFEIVLSNFGLVDMDKLLVDMIQKSNETKDTNLKRAEKKIELVIHLKYVISLVDQLRNTLIDSSETVFSNYIQQLNDADFMSIQMLIDEVINDNTKLAVNAVDMKLEKCFAIKDRYSALLDVSRGMYSDSIDDIYAMVRSYEIKFNIEDIKLVNSISKGYQMQIKWKGEKPDIHLPPIFIDIQKNKSSITFTSEDLVKLNNRITKAVEEIYIQSDSIITTLINNIREKISCLYMLTDIVANVDLLFSFAYQRSCSNYTRPNFGEYTEIRNGVHPIVEKIGDSVPNSLLLINDLNFHIITGSNMSGKTTFLKQIALLQILAQIGSFVPAEYATFRICDRLFTRMALNDNFQMNSSSFMLEVKELKYILNNLTPKSLILLDEIGRGSISNETLAVCWSICESLLVTEAYTILATHFMELTSLDEVYFNVTNYHFTSEINEGNLVRKFPHILHPGPTQERFYGIKLAEMSDLDPSIVEYAMKIAEKGSTQTVSDSNQFSFDNENIINRNKYKMGAMIRHLICNKKEKLDMELIGRLKCEFGIN
ncbi:hypothetical protein RDWZM_007762 [Blomia tropicalis]|uniref:DNA mismatch repair proteins mutS family domain-containing protein n=1 Tax=Blomia tropicalis TaxID=40697 RepID=A0A9Q0M391_BLOTA|nr:hypothetical protein RDWZM_007762 [Blomia tropicalis]